MFTLWAFWCESERVVHFAFQDRAVAEDWRTRYDDGNEFGHLCGPHRLVECGPGSLSAAMRRAADWLHSATAGHDSHAADGGCADDAPDRSSTCEIVRARRAYAAACRAMADEIVAAKGDGKEPPMSPQPSRVPIQPIPCKATHPHGLWRRDGGPRPGWIACPDCIAVKGEGFESGPTALKVCAAHCPLETWPAILDPITAKPRTYFMAFKRRLVGGPKDGLVIDWPSGMREILMPTMCELPSPPCECCGIAAAVYAAQEAQEDGQSVARYVETRVVARRPDGDPAREYVAP